MVTTLFNAKRRLVSVVLSVCLTGLFLVSSVSLAEDPLTGFDEYVLEVMDEWGVPGVTVAVVSGGEIGLKAGYGFRDMNHELPVTEETLFAIGSATKAFTATLLMSLVEEGLLDLDRPVRYFLPAFGLEDMDRANRITAKDLLAHRTGIPRYDLTFMFNPDLTREIFLQNSIFMKPVADFRSTFFYSNHNYILAGLVFEALSGLSWEEGIQQRIFLPLGMTNSNVSIEELLDSPDFALGYYREEDQLREVPYLDFGFSAPAGAVSASAFDLSRWLLGNLGLPGETGTSPILSELSVQTMFNPVTPVLARSSPQVSHLSYGLGWMVENYRGHYHVHHGGSVPGYTTLISLFPEEEIGIAVVCNLTGSPLTSILVNTLADRLLGLEPLDWNALNREVVENMEKTLETLSVLDPSTRKTGTSPTHSLETFTGIFQHPLYGTFRISADGEQLTAIYYQVEFPLEHWHFDVFTGWADYFMPLQLAFRFVTDIYGNPDVLEVDLDPFSMVNPISFVRQVELDMPSPEILSSLTGEYLVMGTPIIIRFSEEQAQLIMQVPEQPDWLLDPLGGLTFRIRGLSGYEVRFTLGETEIEEGVITLIQPQGTYSGKRVE